MDPQPYCSPVHVRVPGQEDAYSAHIIAGFLAPPDHPPKWSPRTSLGKPQVELVDARAPNRPPSLVNEILISTAMEEFHRQITGRKVLVVTDRNVARHYLEGLTHRVRPFARGFDVFRMPPGDAGKTLRTCRRIYQFLGERQADRATLLIALGGGAVSDLCGFAAATWMRGLSWIILATTLEAAVDAAIGGKTAVNLTGRRPPSTKRLSVGPSAGFSGGERFWGGKNLIGAFHHPSLVVVDPLSFMTLNQRTYRAGLAESVKHALVFDEGFVAWHRSQAAALERRDADVLEELILRNLRIKAAIVAEDAKERKGRRILLNFGHTVGHALERCTDYRLLHGECVSLGIVAACLVSEELTGLSASVTQTAREILRGLGLPIHWEDVDRLASPRSPGSAVKADGDENKARSPRRKDAARSRPEVEALLKAMRLDKKRREGGHTMVLLKGLGQPEVVHDVSEDIIRSALQNPGFTRP